MIRRIHGTTFSGFGRFTSAFSCPPCRLPYPLQYPKVTRLPVHSCGCPLLSGSYLNLFMFKIKGTFNYHLEIDCQSLNELSNLTVVAFPSKVNRVPLTCKFQWFKTYENERTKTDVTGNIYPCSTFDIGFRIEAVVTSVEEGYEGQAIIEFQKIQISNALETRLVSLCHNNMRQPLTVNDQTWVFTIDTIENTITKQKLQYQDFQVIQLSSNQLQVQSEAGTMKFKTREERDSFCAYIVTIQSLKRIHLKFIAYNIGKFQQKTVNFQQVLSSQIQQLINQKVVLMTSARREPPAPDPRLGSQADQRALAQLQSQIAELRSERANALRQIEQLQKTNQDLSRSQHTQSQQQSPSQDRLDSLDKLIQSLKTELYQAKQREQELLNQNSRLTLALNEQAAQNQKFHDQSLSQSQFMDDLQAKLLQEKLEQMTFEKNQLQQKLLSMSKGGGQSERIVKQNQELMKEVQSQAQQIKELQLELEMLRNMSRMSMSMSVAEDPASRQRIEQLEQENQYLAKKIAILEEELSKKRRDKQASKGMIEKDAQIQKLAEANKRYMEENLKLYEELRQIRDQSLYSSIRQSQYQDAGIQQQMEEQLSRMQATHLAEITQMKKKMEKLQQEAGEASKLKQQCSQLQGQNKRLVEENASLAEQIKNINDLNLSRSMADSNVYGSRICNTEQLKGLEGQLELLKQQCHELQMKLEKSNSQLQAQQDKMAKLEQENKQLMQDRSSSSYAAELSSQQELAGLKAQLEARTERNAELTQQASTLREKNTQLQNQLRQLTNQSADYSAETTRLKTHIDNLKDKIRQQELDLQSKDKDVELWREKFQQYQTLYQNEIKKPSAPDLLPSRQQDYHATPGKERADYEARITALEMQIQRLTAANAALVQENLALNEKQQANLDSSFATNRSFNHDFVFSRLGTEENQIQNVRATLEQRQFEESKALKSNFDDQARQLSQLKVKSSEQVMKLQSLEIENSQMKREVQYYKDQREYYENKIQELENRLSQVRLKSTTAQETHVRNDQIAMTAQLQHQLQAQIDHLRAEQSESQQVVGRLKLQLQDSQSDLKNSERLNKSLSEQVIIVKRQNDKLNDELQEVLTRENQLQKKVMNFQQQVDKLRQTNEALSLENLRLNEEIQEKLNQSVLSYRSNHPPRDYELEQKLLLSQEALLTKQKELEHSQRQLDQLRAELGQKAQQYEALLSTTEADQRVYLRKQHEYEARTQDYELRLQLLQDQLRQGQLARVPDCNEHQLQLDKANSLLASSNAEQQQLMQKLEHQAQELERARLELRQISDQIMALNVENGQLSQELHGAQRQSKLAELQNIELKQQMEQLRRANEASYLEVQRLTGELNDRLNQSFQSQRSSQVKSTHNETRQEDLEEQLAKTQELLQKQNLQLEPLESQLSHQNEIISQLTRRCQQLEQTAQQLQADKFQSQLSFEQQIEELDSEGKRLAQTVQILQQNLQFSEKKFTEANQAAMTTKSKCEQLEKQLGSQGARLESAQKQAESARAQCAQLKQEAEQKNEELEKLQLECQRLEEELAKGKDDWTRVDEVNRSLGNEIERLKLCIAEQDQQIKTRELTIMKLQQRGTGTQALLVQQSDQQIQRLAETNQNLVQEHMKLQDQINENLNQSYTSQGSNYSERKRGDQSESYLLDSKILQSELQQTQQREFDDGNLLRNELQSKLDISQNHLVQSQNSDKQYQTRSFFKRQIHHQMKRSSDEITDHKRSITQTDDQSFVLSLTQHGQCNCQQEIDEKKGLIQHLQLSLKQTLDQTQLFQQKHSDLLQQNALLAQRIEFLEGQPSKHDELHDIASQLSTHVQALTNQNSALESDVSNCREAHKILDLRREELQKEVEALHEQIRSKNMDIQDLLDQRQRAEEAYRQTLNENKHYNDKALELINRKNDLEDEVARLQRANSALEAQIKKSEWQEIDRQQEFSELLTLRQQLQEKTAEIDSLNLKAKTLKDQYQQQLDKNVQSHEKYQQLVDQNKSLLQLIKQNQSDAETEIERLRNMLSSLQEQHNQQQSTNLQLIKEKSDLAKANEHHQYELADCAIKLTTLTQLREIDQQQFKEERERLTSNVEEWKQKHSSQRTSFSAKIQELELKVSQQHTELAMLYNNRDLGTQQLQQTQRIKTEQEQEIQTLHKQVLDLKRQLAEAKEHGERLTQECQAEHRAKQEALGLISERGRLNSENLAKIQQAEIQISDLSSQNKMKQSQIALLLGQIKTLFDTQDFNCLLEGELMRDYFELKRKNDELKQPTEEIELLKQENEALQNQLSSINAQQKLAEAEKLMYNQMFCDDEEEELELKAGAPVQANEGAAEERSEVIQLGSQNEQLQEQINQLQAQLSEILELNSQLKNELADVEEQYEILRSEKDVVQLKNLDLSRKLEYSESRLIQLEEEVIRTQALVAQWEQLNRDSENQQQLIQDTLAQREESIKMLEGKNSVAEAQLQVQSRHLEELKWRASQAEGSVSLLQEQIQILKQQLQLRNLELEDFNQVKQQLEAQTTLRSQQSEEKIQSQTAEFERLKSEKQELEQLYSASQLAFNNEISRLQQELQSVKISRDHQINTLMEEINSLAGQGQDQQQFISELQDDFKQLQQDLEGQQRETQRNQCELAKLEKDNEALHEELEHSKKERSVISQEKASLKKEVGSLNAEMDLLRTKAAELQALLNEKENQLVGLSKSKQEQGRELDRLKKELLQNQDQLQKVEQLKSEVKDLERCKLDVLRKQQQVKEQQQLVESLQKIIERQEQNTEAPSTPQKQSSLSDVLSSDQKAENYRQSLKGLEMSILQKDRSIKMLNIQNSNLSVEVSNLKNEIEALEKSSAKQFEYISLLEDQFQSQKDAVLKMQGAQYHKDQEIEKLKILLKEMRGSSDRSLGSVGSQKSFRKQSDQSDGMQKELTMARNDCEILQQQLKEKAQIILDFQTKNELLNNQKQALLDEVDKLHGELRTLSEQLKREQEFNAKSQSAISTQQRVQAQLEHQLKKLNEELTVLARESKDEAEAFESQRLRDARERQAEIQGRDTKIAQLQKKLTELEQIDHDSLTQQLAESQEQVGRLEKEIQNLKAQPALQPVKSVQEKEMFQLKEQLEQYAALAETQSLEKEHLKHIIDRYADDIEQLKILLRNEEQDKLKHFKREAECCEKLESKLAEIDNLNWQVKEISEELSEKKKLTRELETVVQKLELQAKEQQSKELQATNAAHYLQHQLEAAQQEIGRLNFDLESKSDELNLKNQLLLNLQGTLERKDDQMELLEEKDLQLRLLQEQVQRLTQTNKALMEENLRLNEQGDQRNSSFYSNDSGA